MKTQVKTKPPKIVQAPQKTTGVKIRVKVDPQLCIGAASCIVVDPDHFDLNPEGKAEVKPSADQPMAGYELELELPDKAALDKLLEGAQACPTQAIFVFDEADQQIFPV